MSHIIAFVGDSITDGGHLNPGADPLGNGFVRNLQHDLSALMPPWTAVNLGIAGNRTDDVRARLGAELHACSADRVSILIGINDVWRRFSDNEPTSGADFERTYRDILELCGDRLLVLCEPFLLPQDEEQSAWLDELQEKRDIIRALARERDALLVPLQDELNRDSERFGVNHLTTDGVHLTLLGHERLAHHWRTHAIESFGARSLIE